MGPEPQEKKSMPSGGVNTAREDWHAYRTVLTYKFGSQDEINCDPAFNDFDTFLSEFPSESKRADEIERLVAISVSVRTAIDLLKSKMPDFRVERHADGRCTHSWQKKDEAA